MRHVGRTVENTGRQQGFKLQLFLFEIGGCQG
jgi:hypothetical protein